MEGARVREPGEMVGRGQVAQLLPGVRGGHGHPDQIGEALEPGLVVVREHLGGGEGEPDGAPEAPADPDRRRDSRAVGALDPEEIGDLRAAGVVHRGGAPRPEDLGHRGRAGERHRRFEIRLRPAPAGGRPHDDPPATLEADDGRGGRLQGPGRLRRHQREDLGRLGVVGDGPGDPLAGEQVGLAVLLVGDVRGRADPSLDPAPVVAHGDRAGVEPRSRGHLRDASGRRSGTPRPPPSPSPIRPARAPGPRGGSLPPSPRPPGRGGGPSWPPTGG